ADERRQTARRCLGQRRGKRRAEHGARRSIRSGGRGEGVGDRREGGRRGERREDRRDAGAYGRVSLAQLLRQERRGSGTALQLFVRLPRGLAGPLAERAGEDRRGVLAT